MAKIPANINERVDVLIPEAAVVATEAVSKVKVNNSARKIEYEIGDTKQPDFYPQFKTKHWNNECNFSARLVTNDGAVTEHDGKLAFNDGEKIARFYEKDTGDEDGGFEFDVVLNSKPASNVLTWTIQHKELDFFYQPALTEQEIAEGASRPENVIGSYAVYHKSKKNNRVGGNEYRTGKAFHIYRPHAVDANGNETWCDLNIDTDTNLMTVTVPQDFVNSAAYPVIVDPTFGYTSAGASYSVDIASASGSIARRRGEVFTATEAGTLDSISFYARVTASTHTISTKVFLNEKDSVSAGSHGQIATAASDISYTSTGDTLQTINTSGESFSATDLILSAMGDGADFGGGFTSLNVARDTVSSTQKYGEINTYSSPESPWVDSGFTNTDRYSIYATYTALNHYTLTAETGSFTLTGISAGLRATRRLTANTGTFTLSGIAAGLRASRKLTAATGAFTLTGIAANLRAARIIAAATGTFTLTGQDATLTYGGGTECTLLQETGDVLLQENDDSILIEDCSNGPAGAYTLTADAGTFTLTGVEAGLRADRLLTAETDTFTLTGIDAGLRADRLLSAGTGSYTLTGVSAGLTRGYTLTAEVGSYTLTGVSAGLTVDRRLVAEPGTFTLTGQDASLRGPGDGLWTTIQRNSRLFWSAPPTAPRTPTNIWTNITKN